MLGLALGSLLLLVPRPAVQDPGGPGAAPQPPVPLGAVVDAPFVDRRWQPRRLREVAGARATVVFFATVDCPLVNRWLPTIGRLSRAHERDGVACVVVNVGAGDHLVDAAAQVVLAAPAAEFAKDHDGALARACGVDRTAAAIVLDGQRRLVYRGRVDDQHGYGSSRERPTRDDLRLAIEDVLAGRPVEVAETAIVGCRITWPEAVAAVDGSRPPTFARDVAPLLQRHCQECHRDGGEAPFPLTTFEHAKKHASMIEEVVVQGRMPPWYGHAAPGTFVNHRGTTASERETIAAWVAAGAPRGDDADLPPPRQWPERGWRIGEPDLVLSVLTPIRLPADGIVPYRYFVLPYRFEHDTWIEGIEIRPDNERVLHHCNLARGKLGEKWSQDGFITGYVPGGDAMVLDPGTAVRIPAGSVLVLQAHYVTTGQPETDRLRVGLRFPRVRVDKELKVTIVADFRFEIPPGAHAHPVTARRQIRDDAEAIGLFVHMHLRGRDMAVFAEHPDGGEERLLVVPNYNFDWQQSYRWPREGKRFAAGTRIRALAHFDNSSFNPFNPDAEAAVRFGQETTDEMMYAFLFWTKHGEALGLAIDPATGRAVGEDGNR